MKTVYVLESMKEPGRRYIGLTQNLERRLMEHNQGKSAYSAKYAPWKIRVSVWFDDDDKALSFEKYLKSGSGHAFAKKHF